MSRLHGSKDFWLGALRADGSAFRAAVAQAPLDAPVPSCPDWTVVDLVHHLGIVYMWVRETVSRGVADPREERPPAAAKPDGAEAVGWWQQEYDALVTLLDGLDPELPAWNWAPQAKKVGFWVRRVAHETAVHRWDAQTAVVGVEPVEAKLAVDGISEVLDTWLPAGRRRNHQPAYGVTHLVATDADQEWYVRLRGEGMALLDTDTILDSDDHHTRTLATGTASDLLLGLWGRVQFDVLDVSGDAALLDALRVG
ncbi:maleylpyruvate isomerase N-terminal domain-containing protein [Solwaraspora sp. WMMD792]|uniref:maleylpyruvate isomerase N-terminal domain-containing protein n=1 Tax=Solwaraspora sp. WMMD792 TaxID=3016099 RepID=UPI002416B09A|nr:maleylpyruvate isomerase N-terminal domain-containing protein [Solwaraspora sp. WMMD792]MDG4773185.1 maleylpyruvate isomerase N-terminal domain-containing protein [Solwaraspora sp. WMMD792]